MLVDIDFPRGPLTAVETWDVSSVHMYIGCIP